MSSVAQVTATRMETRPDGKTVVMIRVAQPVKHLSAALFAHDTIDVAWRVGFALNMSDNDPLLWGAALKLDPNLPPLLELGNIETMDAPMFGPLTHSPIRWVFIKPAANEGVWTDGPPAQAELIRMESLRSKGFAQPFIVPGIPQDSPQFAILAIADGLYITQPQRVPGISLTPFKSDLGVDVCNVLNQILRTRGIPQVLNAQTWRDQMQKLRPAVMIESYVQSESAAAAITFIRPTLKIFLDMMTLGRGAAATLMAGVVTQRDEHGNETVRDAWIEHTGYTENLLGGIISGEDVHALQASWTGLQANRKAQLWVSLYADAVRDPRWDYQFFRCFSLLEAIADEIVPSNFAIIDEAGNPRPFSNRKGNYSTRQAQGKVYALLLSLDDAAANDKLWDSVSLWLEVRNDVAHDGEWQAPSANETPAHAATRAAIMASGHDGSFESGTKPFVNKIRDRVKRTLYAAIQGAL